MVVVIGSGLVSTDLLVVECWLVCAVWVLVVVDLTDFGCCFNGF